MKAKSRYIGPLALKPCPMPKCEGNGVKRTPKGFVRCSEPDCPLHDCGMPERAWDALPRYWQMVKPRKERRGVPKETHTLLKRRSKADDLTKPALRLCKADWMGGNGCGLWNTIPIGQTKAPCKYCGVEVSR